MMRRKPRHGGPALGPGGAEVGISPMALEELTAAHAKQPLPGAPNATQPHHTQQPRPTADGGATPAAAAATGGAAVAVDAS